MTVPYSLYDPSGNITALVEDADLNIDRAAAAAQIMSDEPRCEQVGFIEPVRGDEDIRIAMAGGEFCGNAVFTAAVHFAELNADAIGEGKTAVIKVCDAGTDGLIDVAVEKLPDGYKCSYMFPMQLEMTDIGGYKAVVLQGMTHCILWDPMPDRDAERLIKELAAKSPSEAFGLMFVDAQRLTVRPLVYVKDPETLVWENSCASGSAAIALALAEYWETPFFDTLSFPGGDISISVDRDWRVVLTETIKRL